MLKTLQSAAVIVKPHIDAMVRWIYPKTFSAKNHITFYDRLAFLLDNNKSLQQAFMDMRMLIQLTAIHVKSTENIHCFWAHMSMAQVPQARYALNGEVGPFANTVTVAIFFEVKVTDGINGEEKLCWGAGCIIKRVGKPAKNCGCSAAMFKTRVCYRS